MFPPIPRALLRHAHKQRPFGVNKRIRPCFETLEDRITPAQTKPAIALVDPTAAVRVDQPSYTITGTLSVPAKNNTTILAFRDNNRDGVLDSGDTFAASASVAKDSTSFSISVPLAQNAVNPFLLFEMQGRGIVASARVPWITEDSTPPRVHSITRLGTTPTNASSVQFKVTFSEPVIGVDPTDFQAVTTGSAVGGTIAVTGSGASYTVTVSGLAGAGTLGLNLVDNDSITDILSVPSEDHPLGGAGTGNGNSTGPTYKIDLVPPVVSTINRVGPVNTTGGTVKYTVTFSEPVTGVNLTDFALTTTGAITGATITSVAGSGSTYTVTVNTGTGTGTLRLDVIDDDSIHDLVGNPLGGLGAGNGNFTNGQNYLIVAPTDHSVATIILPAIDLNLLGLEVKTSEIIVSVSADAGNGQLLGNLLNTAANLINLQQAADALNQVLSSTVGLLNGSALGLNLGGGTFATAPVTSTSVLTLHVAPVNLDLLGAVINTNTIDVSITAHSGPGLILGNIVTDLANLFNNLPGQTLNIDTLNTALGNLLNEVNGALSGIAPASVPTVQPNAGQVLNLTVPALDLNLLGLKVQTSPITVNATANTGSGNLLGNVLTSLLNTLGATPDKVAQLNNTLNGILADVVGALNTAVLIVPPVLVAALPPALQTLLSPVLVAPAGSSAPVLDLVIASQNGTSPPVDVNLLGLTVTTSNIDAHISAVTGGGQILGNLLYNVANLANPNGASGLLTLLNALGSGDLNSTAGSSGGTQSGMTPSPQQLLQLQLKPIDLNLLGLEVQTDPITVTLSAQGGDGKLLGNLLGAVSTLVNFPGVGAALNNVLSTAVGLVNSVSLNLPSGAVGSGSFSTADPNAPASTQILDAFVAPVHLDLLGLLADTSPIHVTITAHTGTGLVLGNVVSDLAHLFDNPPSTLTVDDVNTRLAQLLTQLNQQIPGIQPAPIPPVNLAPGQFLELTVPPINLNLLGLILQTSPITVNAFDQTGNGLLLGNFLNALLNTIQATPGNLTVLSQNLDGLLAKVVGVLNAAQLTLPQSAIDALPPVLQTLLSPVLISPTPGQTTQILNLVIASPNGTTPPVQANLLGLVVTTSDIRAQLLAQTGDGEILGNLLYNVANLLNPGSPVSLLFLVSELALL